MMTMGGEWVENLTWMLIQFLSLKAAPKGNNNIINVVSPESLAYRRKKFTRFPKDQSYYQSVL